MSKRAAGSYSSAWRGLTKIVVPPLLAAFTKHEWHGQDYIRAVSPSSGVILAANHLSYADPLPLCLFTHRSGRYPVFLAKSSLF
jgi:1-acyl-sn-glycerol-3-phosphate acyltransferase